MPTTTAPAVDVDQLRHELEGVRTELSGIRGRLHMAEQAGQRRPELYARQDHLMCEAYRLAERLSAAVPSIEAVPRALVAAVAGVEARRTAERVAAGRAHTERHR